ncbi:hypothetical protein H2200_002988 [Cladophialophora chaetospira]|uniref:Heterokaryon incompatibility domain-containing protein n=1 Tax=Cladophialophora chaetospira TaxID=386627 RepID=A0AA38XGN0_9EURO|nr:hypothetical protein H2200_002988 [Cladophialophora chaetospira]
MPVGDTDYIAVSHVWGSELELEWRSVPGIEDEVLATTRKVEFLTEQLPFVVGESYFWMDILCVDQRNDDASVAVTGHIPTIFQYAKRTIVIKDGVGTKDCCGQAVGQIILLDGPWSSALLTPYVDEHASQLRFDEAVLTRLWPFQEIILSDVLQFVCCLASGFPESMERDTPTSQGDISFRTVEDIYFRPVISALQNLAESWSQYGHDGGLDSIETAKFIHAFLNHGQVSRKAVPGVRSRSHGIGDLAAAKDSGRRTTKTRDFVLAIMPQFPWYTVPENAKKMTFGELFVDCFQHQAERGGVKFSPLVTIGWQNTPKDILPTPPVSGNVPTPKTLGEFIRLTCGPPSPVLRGNSNENVALGPLSSYLIEVYPVIGIGLDRRFALELLLSSMAHSTQWWSRAWSSELGDYSVEPRNYYIDGEDLVAFRTRRDPEGLLPRAAAVGTLKILYTWLKLPSTIQRWTPGDKDNWSRIQSWLITNSSYDFIESLLRLAALISCGLGIGAYEWSIQNLTPLRTKFRDKRFLVLSSNLRPRSLRDCEFYLIETKRVEEYERFSLVAIYPGRVPSYSVGLFPCDVFRYQD